jgi:hypothetical protein
MAEDSIEHIGYMALSDFTTLVSHIYTADPSAHVFNGKNIHLPLMISKRGSLQRQRIIWDGRLSCNLNGHYYI